MRGPYQGSDQDEDARFCQGVMAATALSVPLWWLLYALCGGI